MLNVIYDLECYPNIFTFAAEHYETGQTFTFEISTRKNDFDELAFYISQLSQIKARMIGFNSMHYDYPLLHYILKYGPQISPGIIYNKSYAIINASKDEKFNHVIWDREQFVPQIDLFKIHHFDNIAKTTSLKLLEFNMRSERIQDLPYKPGTHLAPDQFDELIKYNHKDVRETKKFYLKSLKDIEFREYLTAQRGKNVMNFNDTKIGKDHIATEIEKVAPGSCYKKDHNGRRTPRQTWRPYIDLIDVIFPYVAFESPGFNSVLQWLKNQRILKTKGVFVDIESDRLGPILGFAQLKETRQKGLHADKLNTIVGGFRYDFGTGGLHGSIESATVRSNATHQIIDVDVTSFYPALAIVNKLFPAHLGPIFCEIYAQVKEHRLSYKKGTPENKALKLALNGTFGDSNSPFSPFYDPAYTMGITINGQLLLCMLAEQLIKIPGLEMIQANTDGLTVLCPRVYIDHFRAVCKWWEQYTALELEENLYSAMFIRDVNNYIAQFENGDIKRKGAYEYKREWNKNHSQLIIPRAAEAVLVNGADPAEFIRNHGDIYDFMLRTKVPRSSYLIMKEKTGERQLQNITRYYISNEGGKLIKVMPPTEKKPDAWRLIGINVDELTTDCNNMDEHTDFDLNYQYYINETLKLTAPLAEYKLVA